MGKEGKERKNKDFDFSCLVWRSFKLTMTFWSHSIFNKNSNWQLSLCNWSLSHCYQGVGSCLITGRIQRQDREVKKAKQGFMQAMVCSLGESGQVQVSSCPEFFGKPVMWSVEMKGWNIQWRGKGLGSKFPDFYPSSTFPRVGGIFVLI